MVSYKLYRSAAAEGLVDLVLHLYQGHDLASVTTIATAAPRLAVRIFMEARVHLRGLGIPESSARPTEAA